MAEDQAEDRGLGPGKKYVTPWGICGITAYLIVVIAVAIVGLVHYWPSCDTLNCAASAADGLAVKSISPGSGAVEGGTQVSIRGTGFTDGVTVNFGDTPASDARIVDSTHMRVRSPTHKQGTVDIVVNNPDKTSRVLDSGFLYVDAKTPPPKPFIHAVSPTSGPLSGGQQVAITGAGLQNVITVSFGGTPGTNVQVLNDTSLMVTTPPHGEGKADVAVDAGATATLAEGYTYTCWAVTPYHLFLMVIFAGSLGGSVYGLRSLIWHVGNRDFRWSWVLMYVLLPITGAAIAVIFFLTVSAGFYTIQGTGNFILIGLSALVGMFSPQAAEKLQDIANGLLTKPK